MTSWTRVLVEVLVFIIAITYEIFYAYDIFGCGMSPEEREVYYRDRISTYTNAEMPIDSTMVLFKDNYTQSIEGDIYYCVYTFENEPTEWLNEASFNDEKNSIIESNFFKRIEEHFVGVEQEYLPDFEETYFWLNPSGMYFVYNINDLKLYYLCVVIKGEG